MPSTRATSTGTAAADRILSPARRSPLRKQGRQKSGGMKLRQFSVSPRPWACSEAQAMFNPGVRVI